MEWEKRKKKRTIRWNEKKKNRTIRWNGEPEMPHVNFFFMQR